MAADEQSPVPVDAAAMLYVAAATDVANAIKPSITQGVFCLQTANGHAMTAATIWPILSLLCTVGESLSSTAHRRHAHALSRAATAMAAAPEQASAIDAGRSVDDSARRKRQQLNATVYDVVIT